MPTPVAGAWRANEVLVLLVRFLSDLRGLPLALRVSEADSVGRIHLGMRCFICAFAGGNVAFPDRVCSGLQGCNFEEQRSDHVTEPLCLLLRSGQPVFHRRRRFSRRHRRWR